MEYLIGAFLVFGSGFVSGLVLAIAYLHRRGLDQAVIDDAKQAVASKLTKE